MMTLKNFSIYHWPSQRLITVILTLSLLLVGTGWRGARLEYTPFQSVLIYVMLISGAWLIIDSIFHVAFCTTCRGKIINKICRLTDNLRPIFLTVISASNIFYAADILFNGSFAIGIIILHIVHSAVFVYILAIDWFIDNYKKLNQFKYKRG